MKVTRKPLTIQIMNLKSLDMDPRDGVCCYNLQIHLLLGGTSLCLSQKSTIPHLITFYHFPLAFFWPSFLFNPTTICKFRFHSLLNAGRALQSSL